MWKAGLVRAAVIGTALTSSHAAAQIAGGTYTPGYEPYFDAGAKIGTDCNPARSQGFNGLSGCQNTLAGSSALAAANQFELKAKVEVDEGGFTSTNGAYGDYAAFSSFTDSIFVQPTDTQYTGGAGTLSFTYHLDGTMTGDLGNIVNFNMSKLSKPDPNVNSWSSSYGSATWDIGIYDASTGALLSRYASPISAFNLFGQSVDVYIDGKVTFTFAVNFNSYSTFSRELSTYAGTAGSKVDFFNTGSLLNVQAFNAGGQAIDTDLLSSVGNYNGVASGVPEPSTWAMMLLGFGAIGASMRRRQLSRGKAHSGH